MKKMNLFAKDIAQTKENRERLFKNKNLLFWYQELYSLQFQGINGISDLKILEIGSGSSPLKLFHKNVLTSDILELDYLDYVFDCHEIDRVKDIQDSTLDFITLTNVLHHLSDPVEFLLKASVKLKKTGSLIIAEPFFSIFSTLIYKNLHYEDSIFQIEEPRIRDIDGPLSSANMAIPYMLFFKKADWLEKVIKVYDFNINKVTYYSAFSYMMTGGVKRIFAIPCSIYKAVFRFDCWLANRFPRIFCSFFLLKLNKK